MKFKDLNNKEIIQEEIERFFEQEDDLKKTILSENKEGRDISKLQELLNNMQKTKEKIYIVPTD